MSRKPGRSQEESSKLRKELKRLKLEIDQLKKASKNIYVITGNDKSKLVLNIQENLKQADYSPNKVQPSRSPIHSRSKKTVKHPTEKIIKDSVLPENNENFSTSRETEFLSPHFADNTEVLRQNTEEPKIFDQFNTTVLKENHQSVNKAIENLQNENNMLKMLNNLKIENERLRSQIQLGKTESRKENLKKNHSKNKVSFIDLGESSQQAKHAEEKLLMQSKINLSQKSQKTLKKSRRRSTNQADPTFISIKLRSPSEIIKSTQDHYSDLFLFPESATHQKKQSILSSSFSKSITKSPTSISIGNLDINISSRGQSCKNCDYLLFKGRPTRSCSDHNYK